jgi:NTE family protein
VSTPRVAVVIGSGGLKCLAAIALFEFLEKEGITPALLVGASGGGTLAAAAGIGLDAARMQDLAKEMVNPRLFRRFDWRAVLGAIGIPFFRFEQTSGLVKPGPIRAVFRRIFGDRRLEDLPIRTVLLATDLTSFEPVALERGPVADAVYASATMPVLLPPLEIEGRLLGDAFYSATLPVMEAVKRDVDVIIAFSVEELIAKPPRGLLRFYLYAFTRALGVSQRLQTALAIQLHHHEIVVVRLVFDRPIEPWDTSEIPAIIETGRRAVAAKRHEILAAVRRFGGPA